jgi:hypothetical protein
VPAIVPVQLLHCRTSLQPICLVVKGLDVRAILLVGIKVALREVVVELLAVPFCPVRLVPVAATLARSRHCEIMAGWDSFIACLLRKAATFAKAASSFQGSIELRLIAV